MKIFTLRNSGITILLTVLIALSGCNSGTNETSTGGSGSTSPSSLAGTYTGTATATASALGLSESETVPVTIIIDQNGGVTVQSGSDIFPDVITLNGNSFSQSQTFNKEDFGSVICSGTLTLQGSIDSNGKLTATLSSQSVVCSSNGVDIPGIVSGSMTATKQ
ncbi:MAG: hypothetical protein ACN4GR_00725 [Arenicellales bacterium]